MMSRFFQDRGERLEVGEEEILASIGRGAGIPSVARRSR